MTPTQAYRAALEAAAATAETIVFDQIECAIACRGQMTQQEAADSAKDTAAIIRALPVPGVSEETTAYPNLIERLRGRYPIGPHLPNGEPEFGWRQFEAPPIQHEAADELARLRAEIERLRKWILAIGSLPDIDTDLRGQFADSALDGDPAPTLVP